MKLTMEKVWSFNKYAIGFEGGKVPSRAISLWFLWPTVVFSPYNENYLYGYVLSFHLLKWYAAIKWNRRPDNE